MNVRKPVDYSAMFAELDTLMAADLPQMELCCEIGRLVSARAEKGSAVAAAEYLCSAYPDASGFSPRNLRRMREFYRAYENAPDVLAEAMTIGWTQNGVILEAELTPSERAWYIRAAGQFGWSKLELQRKINDDAHLEIVLDITDEVCYTGEETSIREEECLPDFCADTAFGDKVVDETTAYTHGLYRMKQFYETYRDDEFVTPLVNKSAGPITCRSCPVPSLRMNDISICSFMQKSITPSESWKGRSTVHTTNAHAVYRVCVEPDNVSHASRGLYSLSLGQKGPSR